MIVDALVEIPPAAWCRCGRWACSNRHFFEVYKTLEGKAAEQTVREAPIRSATQSGARSR